MTTIQQHKLRRHLLNIETELGAIRMLLDQVDDAPLTTAQVGVDYTISSLQDELNRMLPAGENGQPPLRIASSLPTTPTLPRSATPPVTTTEVVAERVPLPLDKKGTADLMGWLSGWEKAIDGLDPGQLAHWDDHRGKLKGVVKYMTDAQLEGLFKKLTEAAWCAGIEYQADTQRFAYQPIPEAQPA